MMIEEKLNRIPPEEDFAQKIMLYGWWCHANIELTNPLVTLSNDVIVHLRATKGNQIIQQDYRAPSLRVYNAGYIKNECWRLFYESFIKPLEEPTKHYFSFKDLVFEPHETFRAVQKHWKPGVTLYERYKDSKHAVLTFPNGYGVSVITGQVARANHGRYEVCALYDGKITSVPFWNDVLANQTEEEVTQAMKKLQDL